MKRQEIQSIGQKLVNYFEHVVAANPKDLIWQLELDLAKRWVDLMAEPNIEITEVEQFMEAVNQHEGGTGWGEVQVFARIWQSQLLERSSF